MMTNYVLIPYRDESADSILKRLKRGLLKVGLFRELKVRQSFTKPSEARRIKSQRARARVRKSEKRIAARMAWYDENAEGR